MNPLRGCSPRASCRHSTVKTITVSRTTWPGRRRAGNEPLDPHPEPGAGLVARQLGQGGAQRRGPSTREQLVRCDRVIQDHPEGHQQHPPGQPGTGPPGGVHPGRPPHSPGYVRHRAVLCALACAQGSLPPARQTRAERRGTTIADSRIVSRAARAGNGIISRAASMISLIASVPAPAPAMSSRRAGGSGRRCRTSPDAAVNLRLRSRISNLKRPVRSASVHEQVAGLLTGPPSDAAR